MSEVKHWEFVSAFSGIFSCPEGQQDAVRDRIERAIEGAILPMDKDGVALLQQTFSKREIDPAKAREARGPVKD